MDRGRVRKKCFRVSLKHASLWAEIFKKLRLKGLQMEMILGKRGVVVGGQRSWTKHVSGLVSKHASLCSEIFKKVRLKGLFSYLHMFLSNTCRTAANRILRSTSTIPTARKRCCFWVRGLALFFSCFCLARRRLLALRCINCIVLR